jgi:hypothetical protein
MALVPVFCDNCGTIFATASFVGGDARGVSLDKARLGPCPTCGGRGRVPDGVYDFIGDTARALSAPRPSREQLEGLAKIIEDGRAREAPAEEIASQLQAEAPELEPVINAFIEQRPDPLRWIYLLQLIIGVLPQGVPPQEDPSDEDIERVSRGVVEELRERPAAAIPQQPEPAASGRQEPKSATPERPRRQRAVKQKTGKTYGQRKKRRRR